MDERTGSLSSCVDLEDRVPAKHPLRVIRRIVNDVLAALDSEFAMLYADGGRPSIAPERLLRALLLQAFYTIRSVTQLMEQVDYNLLYRRFVIRQQKRTRTEEARSAGPRRSAGLLGPCYAEARLRFKFTLTTAAYDLIRLPKLLGSPALPAAGYPNGTQSS